MSETTKKSRFHFNVGVIPFLMIFVYIIGHLVLSMMKEDLAVYQVIQSQIHESIRTTGIILREETIVKSKNSGYPNYYVNEGEIVSKYGLVYTCDKTGEAHDYISNYLAQKNTLQAEDYEEIQELLDNFHDNYTDSDYSYVYDLKYQLENQALKLGDAALADHMDEIEAQIGSGSFIKNYSPAHGIVTYVEDGYESMTVDKLETEDFLTAEYEKINLKTEEKMGEGESVYRLTTSTDWKIVLSISNKDYLKIKDKTRLKISLDDGRFTFYCPVSFEQQKDGYFAILSLTNYINYFITDRYIDVEVEIRSEDGLKIPNTAIEEKEHYKIPEKYFTGKSEAKKTLVIKKTDAKGVTTFESLEVEIGKYETDEEDGQKYCYVLKEDIPENTLISLADSSEEMLLKETVMLPGVYNINKGYADFRCVDILIENKEYTIVRAKVTNSISLFDRIVLNGNTIENNDIVY